MMKKETFEKLEQSSEEAVAIESGEMAPARATIHEVPEKSMRKARTILYPQSILDPRTPDEMFREEAQAMTAAGHNEHLIDTEALTAGPARVRPPIEAGCSLTANTSTSPRRSNGLEVLASHRPSSTSQHTTYRTGMP